MCNLSDGVEQRGTERGVLLTLSDLVQDNLLPIEEAAKRVSLTVEEFQRKMKELD